jgi:hypothetical protein
MSIISDSKGKKKDKKALFQRSTLMARVEGESRELLTHKGILQSRRKQFCNNKLRLVSENEERESIAATR